MTRRTWTMLTAATLCCLSLARDARANTATTAAAEAFSRAQAATLEGDHARAAELYDLAHRLVPSPEALRSAARSHYAAGHIGVAATRAEELLAGYREDASSRALAETLLDRVRDRVTRVYLTCAPSCTVSVDGAAAVFDDRSQHTLYVTPGEHEFTATFPSGSDDTRSERGEAGGELGLAFTEPERTVVIPDTSPPDDARPEADDPAPPRPVPDSRPAPTLVPAPLDAERDEPERNRAAVAALATTTVALAAATTWSAVDIYQSKKLRAAGPPADDRNLLSRQGLRTGVLAGVTLVGAATTLIVHAAGRDTDERAPGPRPPDWGVSAARGGVSVSLGGSF